MVKVLRRIFTCRLAHETLIVNLIIELGKGDFILIGHSRPPLLVKQGGDSENLPCAPSHEDDGFQHFVVVSILFGRGVEVGDVHEHAE